MEYLLIVGVILVIAAGAVLTMTKFNPTKTATEGLDKSKSQLTEMNMAVGPIGVKQAGLTSAGTLTLVLQNNKADTVQIDGIKACDATSADCSTFSGLIACSGGAKTITSGSTDTCSIDLTTDVTPDAPYESSTPSSGSKQKIKFMIVYTVSGAQSATTPGTIEITVV